MEKKILVRFLRDYEHHTADKNGNPIIEIFKKGKEMELLEAVVDHFTSNHFDVIVEII
mgnify:CR=1 FL=1|tara:strand:- start:4321 stop:4494 length:174 start_codon:yes stop_codon:yes gene_type:complete